MTDLPASADAVVIGAGIAGAASAFYMASRGLNVVVCEKGRIAGEQVYRGMVIGEHARDNDLEVNPLKGKKLTNIRAAGKDDAVILTPPVRFGLEEAIAYIDDDELVEVTPRSIRLRKRHLDPHERKRHARAESV